MCVVGGIMTPKGVYILTLGTCGYVSLQMDLRLLIN